MKKNMATAMAAAMAFGAVVPAFANEIAPLAVVSTVDTALAEGRKVSNVKYDGAYDTKFTESKKDDTLKSGVIILDIISEDGDGEYLISEPFSTQDYKDRPNLENDIKQAKKDLADTESEIKHLLTLTYKDAKGATKKLYTMNKEEIEAETGDVENKLVVTLTNNQDNSEREFTFTNIVIKEAEKDPSYTKETLDIKNYADKDYRLLSEYVYELEKNTDKITVTTREVNKTTLALEVYKKDAKKSHVATIEIMGYDSFDKEKFVKISGKNDFVNHWAEDTIFDAMYNDIVDASAKFRPEDNISRAEFIKIVNRTFGFEDKAAREQFADVDSKDWFYDDVLIALEAGYINGYEDGTFKPEKSITRQEAAVIVAKAAGYAGETKVDIGNGKFVDKDVNTGYKDDKSIEAWADESVLQLKDAGIIEGYSDKTFKPANNIKRAEALVMMTRAEANQVK